MYLGKRIEVRIPQRGNDGKLNGKFTSCAGICEMEPCSNEYLEWGLQITINRMPIQINSLNDIKICNILK